MSVRVRLMRGMGDTLYQRPVLRALVAKHGTVFVDAAFPELVDDIPGVRCDVANAPKGAEVVAPRYGLRGEGATILDELAVSARVSPDALAPMDLPPAPRTYHGEAPMALIRPVTIRRSWLNPARAPRPEYVAEAAEHLRRAGYHVISVADLRDEYAEWALDPLPAADETYHAAELPPLGLVGLVRDASVVVGGVGWIVPAAVAAGTPLVCIGGGNGAHNAPEVIGMDPATFIAPDTFCRCADRFHRCPKTITDFGHRFAETLARTTAPAVAA